MASPIFLFPSARAESVNRAGAYGTSQRHFLNDAGRADKNDKMK